MEYVSPNEPKTVGPKFPNSLKMKDECQKSKKKRDEYQPSWIEREKKIANFSLVADLLILENKKKVRV